MRIRMRFRNPNLSNIGEWMRKCFDQLLLMIQDKLKIQPHDKVGFSFQNVESGTANFHISFRRYDQLNSDVILTSLESVLQSNTYFLANEDDISINVDHIKIPIGYGRRSFIGKSSEDFFKIHKNSIYMPKLREEDGNICLPVAILIGKAYADGAPSQNLYNFLTYENNHDDLIKEAEELALAAGVDFENGCGIEEIQLFQRYFSDRYSIDHRAALLVQKVTYEQHSYQMSFIFIKRIHCQFETR